MAYTLFALGACNCPSGSCSCAPCNLPQSSLTVTYKVSGSTIFTTTLAYSSGCNWSTGCYVVSPTNSQLITISCTGGVTTITINLYTNNACSGTPSTLQYISSGGGSGLTLVSSSCSPSISIVVEASANHNDQWTFT